MIGLLRSILDALRRVLDGQQAAAERAEADMARIGQALADQSAAIDHVRSLIEGDLPPDTTPTAVGVPTFTPQGD